METALSWRCDHLATEREEQVTKRSERAVLLYQGVSTIAPETTASQSDSATSNPSVTSTRDDFVMTVLLEREPSTGPHDNGDRCVVHACHVTSKNIYHRCSLTPHLAVLQAHTPSKPAAATGIAASRTTSSSSSSSSFLAPGADLTPLRAAVKTLIARLRFSNGEVVVGSTAVRSEDDITDIGSGGGGMPPLRTSVSPSPQKMQREQSLRFPADDNDDNDDNDEALPAGGLPNGSGGPPNCEWNKAPPLPDAESAEAIGAELRRTGDLQVRFVTWNMHAKPPPPVSLLRQELFPLRAFHVYVVGTEECEHSIASSIIRTSKEKWESLLREVLGDEYVMLCGHALQATHNIVYAHRGVLPFISAIKTHAVSTGVKLPGNRLGNKGGIGISFSVGGTAMVFINAHLAHALEGYDRRNEEYWTITAGMARALIPTEHQSKKGVTARRIFELERRQQRRRRRLHRQDGEGAHDDQQGNGVENAADIMQDLLEDRDDAESGSGGEDSATETSHGHAESPVDMSNDVTAADRLLEWFDVVVWGGDLNYRVTGDRGTVDALLKVGDIRPLLAMDQLRGAMATGASFKGLTEGQIQFLPTYKFDKACDDFDTSAKQRVPSWTDRILYKPDAGGSSSGGGGGGGAAAAAAAAARPVHGEGERTPPASGSLAAHATPSKPDATSTAAATAAVAKVNLLSYGSVQNLRTSDHRPVQASFLVHLDLDDEHGKDPKHHPDGVGLASSQVCSVM